MMASWLPINNQDSVVFDLLEFMALGSACHANDALISLAGGGRGLDILSVCVLVRGGGVKECVARSF